MAEQSHKEEMRAALRGDFERLRARSREPARPDRRPPERIVLTPPPKLGPMPEPVEVEASEPAGSEQVASRPLLRRLFRRG